MRTVLIKSLGSSTVAMRVLFKEGKKVVASFKFFNYNGNGDTLSRAVYEFVTLGQIPVEGKGFLDVD